MLPPYQSLLFCRRGHQEENNIILCASGSSIFSFSALDGSFLSEWSSAIQKVPAVTTPREASVNRSEEFLNTDDGRKRRKLSTQPNGSDSESPEIVVNSGKQKPSEISSGNDTAPFILRIIGTSDGEHVIAITAEDKSVRVLNLQANGRLETLSERYEQKQSTANITADVLTGTCQKDHAPLH